MPNITGAGAMAARAASASPHSDGFRRNPDGTLVVMMREFLFHQVTFVLRTANGAKASDLTPSQLVDDPVCHNTCIVMAPGVDPQTVCRCDIDPVDYAVTNPRRIRVFHYVKE